MELQRCRGGRILDIAAASPVELESNRNKDELTLVPKALFVFEEIETTSGASDASNNV